MSTRKIVHEFGISHDTVSDLVNMGITNTLIDEVPLLKNETRAWKSDVPSSA